MNSKNFDEVKVPAVGGDGNTDEDMSNVAENDDIVKADPIYAVPVKSTRDAYLFAYFVGNEPEQERIHFAVSRDGYHFEALNGNEPIIIPTKGKKCVRDPFVLRGKDGCFYIIATDMKSSEGWLSNHALATWKSKDLIHWTDETNIDIRDFGGEFAHTTRAWAPEAIWDENEGKFMVYWANSTEENDLTAIYYSYTEDFKSLSYPKLLFAREGQHAIDADIVYNKNNKKYYMYFKFEESSKIAYVKSDNLTGPYGGEPPVVASLTQSGTEGSAMFNINGSDAWVMFMDEYGKNRYFAQQTFAFENFLEIRQCDLGLDISPRHGSVMFITDEEYDALARSFGANRT